MPLPKHLKPRASTTTADRSVTYSKCVICNNLDPRHHRSTCYRNEAKSRASFKNKGRLSEIGSSTLSLPLDLWRLARLEDDEHTCRFCRVLIQALDAFLPEWRAKRAGNMLELGWKTPIKLVLEGGDAPKVIEIFSRADRSPPWPALGSAFEIPSDPASNATLEFIRKCLKSCGENHADVCGAYAYKPPACERLLEISDDQSTLKLVRSPRKVVKYVALSHCWGEHLPLTTTKESLARRKRGIKFSELPPLYQDVVNLCVLLEIRYLWIDSVSIVQDVYEDWAKESAKMADIYAGAFLTLAALDAQDSTYRFLTPRNLPQTLRYKNTKAENFTLKARCFVDHHPDLATRRPAALTGPLASRAWTLQEHIISSRILHFTSTEAVFECRNAYACECKPALKSSWPSTPNFFEHILHSQSPAKQYGYWHRLIEKYTLRVLTRPNDKLPALSGLAHRFQEMVDSEYCAGLWRKNLADDLLWSSAPWLRNPHATSLLLEYRAPSWSWASVETQVRYEEAGLAEQREVERLVSRVKAVLEVDPLNILGVVGQASFMKLEGPIVEGILVAPEEYEFYYTLKLDSSPVIDVFPDCILVADDGDPVEYPKIRARRARSKEEYSPFKSPVLCLGVSSSPTKGIITGLVLGRPSRTTKQMKISRPLERLGVFSCGIRAFAEAEKGEVVIV